MKYFFFCFFIFFFFNSCSEKFNPEKELPDGIYLVRDCIKGETGDTVTVELTFHDSLDHFIEIQKRPLLRISLIKRVWYEEGLWNDKKDTAFHIDLTEAGQEHFYACQEKYDSSLMVFVMKGKIIGMANFSDPSPKDDYSSISFRPFGIRDSLEKWTNAINHEISIRDSLSYIHPVNGTVKRKFDNGNPELLEEYDGDTLVSQRKYYYETGTLKSAMCYCKTKMDSFESNYYEKTFYKNGLIGEEKFLNDSEELTLSFQENGHPRSVIISSTSNSYYLSYDYYLNGVIDEEYWNLPLPDKNSSLYNLSYEKKYKNGLVTSEGTLLLLEANYIYDTELDSIGLWKYYSDGKLIATKKFPSVEYSRKQYDLKPKYKPPFGFPTMQ
jgi:hypothetical protein